MGRWSSTGRPHPEGDGGNAAWASERQIGPLPDPERPPLRQVPPLPLMVRMTRTTARQPSANIWSKPGVAIPTVAALVGVRSLPGPISTTRLLDW